MIIKRNHAAYSRCTALYLSAACLMLACNTANSAEPFQILTTDLPAAPQAAAAQMQEQAQPFQMLATDTAKVTIYQGTDSAGDAEITNNSNEALYFNDQSTASSATIINNSGGTTRFNDSTTAASAFITNNADAQLSFNDESSAADARITNNGGGHLQFDGNANAGSAVITNNGTTIFNGNSSADNALITNNATGMMEFNDQSGAGKRNIYNNGHIAFTGQSSAQNSLIDNNQTGSIRFSDDSTGASSTINNSGQLAFTGNSSAEQAVIVNNETGRVRFDGNTSGANATLTNNGSAVFAGHSNAQDARLINNAGGNLRFQDSAGAGSGMIVNAGDLTFSDTSSAGQASVTTSEGGTTRFEGNADGGTASLQIDQNARLDIAGMKDHALTLGTLTSAGDVNLGRTTLSVQNNLVLNDSSKLSLVLGYGRLIADEVELQGGTLALERAADLLYTLGETYRIIDAQSLSGSNFAPEILHDFAFATPLSSADGTSIILERNDVLFAEAAQSQNQLAVANAVETLATDTLPYRLLISGTQSDARSSFDQLSGEIHATALTAVHDKSSHLRAALLERARNAADNTANTSSAPWQSWLKAAGSVSHYDSNANTGAARLSGYSVTGGFDYGNENGFSAGFAGGYEQDTLTLNSRASSADIKTFGAGLYGAWRYQGFSLSGGAAYQHHALDTDRSLTLPALSGTMQSSYKGWTGQLFAEAGYRFDIAGLSVEPFGRLSYIRSRLNGFEEQGLSDVALSGTAATLSSTTGTAGLMMRKRFMLDDNWQVDAQFEAAWNRAFGHSLPVRHMAFSSGLPFEITGTGINKDALLLDARLSFLHSNRFGLNIIYSGLLNNTSRTHHFGSTATIRF